MKLLRKVAVASSFGVGSLCLLFAVSNLEFQEYTDSPLFDWRILAIIGVVAYIPFFIYIIRKEIKWRDNL